MTLTWETTYAIALELRRQHPDVEPGGSLARSRSIDWTLELEEFEDDPALCNDDILYAIYQEWFEENIHGQMKSSIRRATRSRPTWKTRSAITTLDRLYNWGRRSSVWPMMFGLACCAIEMIAAQAAPLRPGALRHGGDAPHARARPT